MSEVELIAVVTGGNKGIGYEIVKGLCKVFKGKVYLAARSETRGRKAIEELNKDGCFPEFFELDITNGAHREKFAKYIKEKHGGLDVLVNNAAIAYKNSATEPFSVQAEDTLNVNYFSTLALCSTLFPLLRPHARVVNVSSSAGHLSIIPSGELRKKLSSDTLTIESLSELANKFVTDAKNGNHTEQGWPNSAYAVSKVFLSALTFIQQRNFNNDKREDIVINCVHPGYCDTDMTSHKGPMSPEQGSAAAVKLATLPQFSKSPIGQYIWHDMRIVDWVNGPRPSN